MVLSLAVQTVKLTCDMYTDECYHRTCFPDRVWRKTLVKIIICIWATVQPVYTMKDFFCLQIYIVPKFGWNYFTELYDQPLYIVVIYNLEIFYFIFITVYQRTPDIAISEACVFLQGRHTRSIFLDVFANCLSFQLKNISVSPLIYWSIFVTTTNNQENSVRATLENIVLPNHRFGVWFSSDHHENGISVKNMAIYNQNMVWYVVWMVISTCSLSRSS